MKKIHDHYGEKNPMFGKHHSLETIEKIRNAHKKSGHMWPDQTGYEHTEETKKKIGKAMIGNTYSKGIKWSLEVRLRITKIEEHIKNNAFRNSVEYRNWRETIFKRDDYTCQLCSERGGRLQADHIKKFADYPELRLDLNNGRTLCEPCHKLTPNYMNRRPSYA